MNTKNNQRFRDNEKKIEVCFINMLNSTDISKITVRSICEEAGINRTTFYAHYTDIYDLLDKLELKMRARIIAQYEEMSPEEIVSATPEYLIPFLTFIKENQLFYKACLHKRTEFPIKTGFEALWNTVVKPRCIKRGITSEEEMMYYFVFYQAGYTMCMKRWVDNGCKESPEELCQYFINCAPKSEDSFLK